jgi:LmbE family N-acetylglucosaminyl deacetylase
MKDFIRNIIRLIRNVYFHYRLKFMANPLPLLDSVIVLSPHPDDEALGCAGLVQHLQAAGENVYVVILTGGEASHNEHKCGLDKKKIILERRSLSRDVAQMLHLPNDHLYFLNYPDGGVVIDSNEKLELKQIINSISPRAIFVSHVGDRWSDHVNVKGIVESIIGPEDSIQLFAYCVWFWYWFSFPEKIDWDNACILKMTKEQQNVKIKVLDHYLSLKAPCGEPWCGLLPQVLIRACSWKYELFFKLKR